MNLNLNIDTYGGKSVVPITCRGIQGTGFYIGSNRFLTAYHVVSDAEYDNSEIIALIDNKEIPCSLLKLGDMDAALLESHVEIDESIIEPIPLLATGFKKDLDLEIIGFPQEIGNGIDYFGLCVKNIRNLSHHEQGFDIMVQRTDAFGFYSYSGFSGSPVLNEFGYAVGIVTDQIHKSLGYTSIESIRVELDRKGVSYERNADILDTRPYGLGYSFEYVKKAINRAKTRYNENLHVQDEELENNLHFFCGIGVENEKQKLCNSFNSWYNVLPADYKVMCDKYQAFKAYVTTGNIEDKLYYDLEGIAHEKDTKYKENAFLKGQYMTRFQELLDEMQEVQDVEDLYKNKYLYISADAGLGKTHHLCHAAKILSQQTNVYLFFGTEFCSTDDPLKTISEMMHWDNPNYLNELNDEMVRSHRYAVFIIDALNEGAGTFFWYEKLPQLQSELERYDNIKLIVSVRRMENNDSLREVFKKSEWKTYELGGFNYLKYAIERYFEYYHINENPEDFIAYTVFSKPLFLRIFCESYFSLPFDKRKDIDILYLYRLYFHKRNIEVSRETDEDPQRDVTSNLIYRIGERSLLTYNCCDIPRDKALSIANKLCRNRFWSNNLYHNSLRANLLMEYNTYYGVGYTTFEYDSMGDYVRADRMLALNQTDDEVFAHLKRLVLKFNDKSSSPKERKQIFNTIKAFLSVWNPDSSYWEKPEFSVGILKEALIQSLGDRNTNSSRSSLNEKTASEIVKSGKDFFDVTNIFKQFELYKNQLMPMLHEALFKMSLIERDERWTIGVNKLMDTYSFSSTINRVTINDKKDRYIYVWILCWMQSSSHPSVRNRLIRIIESFMENDQGLCLQMIDLFHNVNDPYIQFGVYSSIYGALLNSNNPDLTHKIAKLVYEKHFAGSINVPSDINVRIWTLKILEYNNYLNPSDEFWEQSQPPYGRTVNLMDYPRNEDFDSNEYFGTGEGAKKIHHSLFGWDFNRYIIGTNSTNDSHTFIKEGNKVKLDDITKAVAYRIKSIIGYSEELSNYDITVPWEERSYRRTERIGKKYQWIALGEVKAYLSDTCQMTKDWFNDEIAEKPYPWYADRITHFDPTLHIGSNHITVDNDMFGYLDKEDLFKSDGKDWIDSREELPSQHIIIKDKNNTEWVILVGYQKNNQAQESDKRESFIYYSPCLVKNEADNIERFREWASKQNYYGRWMPESTGNYDYLWNEYPWADCYKQSVSGEIEIWRNGAPCLISLPYSAQLQEDREGINDEEDVNSTVYMPHADMYKMFSLRNAERGVVRNKDGEIIALNRNIPGDTLDALVIRRDYLNRFLEEKGYSLFYCNLAEKQLWNESTLLTMQRLSSCYEYHPKNHVIELQPMTDERDFPKEPESEEHGLEGFDIENWLTLEQSGNNTPISDYLKRIAKNHDEDIEGKESSVG